MGPRVMDLDEVSVSSLLEEMGPGKMAPDASDATCGVPVAAEADASEEELYVGALADSPEDRKVKVWKAWTPERAKQMEAVQARKRKANAARERKLARKKTIYESRKAKREGKIEHFKSVQKQSKAKRAEEVGVKQLLRRQKRKAAATTAV